MYVKVGSGFLLLINMSAKGTNATFITCWFARGTNISTMQDQPVMSQGNLLFRYVLYELHLCFIGIFCPAGKSDTVRHPEDMCINGHGWLAEKQLRGSHWQFYVPLPAAPAALPGIGNLSMEFLFQYTGHTKQVFCFVIGVGTALNQFEYLLGFSISQGCSIRKDFVEGRE